MIRTRIITCNLNRDVADSLNLESGRIYTQVLVSHWRAFRKKGVWISPGASEKLNDFYNPVKRMHAHTIDAAQQGFAKAIKTGRALRKIDPTARFPHRIKKFRTTIWKQTGIKRSGNTLTLSNGRGNAKIMIALPECLADALRILEVRLVYNVASRKYQWHIVAEDGKQPKLASGTNTVSVDLGEIHPAVVGDEDVAVIVTCRERRHQMQGHAKRLAQINQAISRTKKGSRRNRKLRRTKARMIAKHNQVMRDITHKISREIVNVAVECAADTIVMGDIKDIADGVNFGKKNNQKISGWNHGNVRSYVEYKAEAEGIETVLQDEHYTSQTCPNCSHRHKPRGRNYRCPSCGFQSHRDVVGQVNILSAYKHGTPGKIPAPTVVKHREPYSIRRTRRCRDTGQTSIACL